MACPDSFPLAGFEVTMIGRFWGDHRGFSAIALFSLIGIKQGKAIQALHSISALPIVRAVNPESDQIWNSATRLAVCNRTQG